MREHVTKPNVLFVAGLVLTVTEAITRQVERPYFLALFGGMMGLPAFWTSDSPKKPPAGEP